MSKLENRFQSELIKELYSEYPDCVVLKNDPNYLQGIPDLLVIYGTKYAFLECKRYSDASRQANQDYYIRLFDNWSFARFIFPENKDEVLQALRSWLIGGVKR